MAKITSVDYEAIPGIAQRIRNLGAQINGKMTDVYAKMTEMHNNWYGKRYNALIEQFNNLIPSLNDLIKIAEDDLPITLTKIANNYAMADTGAAVSGAMDAEMQSIAEIPVSNDVGMRFLTAEVTTTQTEVQNNFKSSVDLMGQIEQASNSMVWESEAAEAYKARFAKLKSEIVSSFENLNSQFTTLMNQTLEDIQSTENANTVN